MNKFIFLTIFGCRTLTFYAPGKDADSSSSVWLFKAPSERNPWDNKVLMGKTVRLFPAFIAYIRWSICCRTMVSSLWAFCCEAGLCCITAPCWVCAASLLQGKVKLFSCLA